MLLDDFFGLGLFVKDFGDLLFDDGLHGEGLRSDGDDFDVAFYHFDCAFMAVQVRSLLLLLKSGLFVRMSAAITLGNIVTLKVVSDHLV